MLQNQEVCSISFVSQYIYKTNTFNKKELFPFVILNNFLYSDYAYAMIVHTHTEQLVPQLLMGA